MSRDKTLKSRNTLKRHRNVLSRTERILSLQEIGQFAAEQSPFHLPKVAHRKASVGKKGKEKKKEEAAPGAEGTTPAKTETA